MSATTCTHHNDQQRTECPVCLVAALITERDQLRDQLAAARQRETVAIASWDEERGRALREGARVVQWIDRAECAEADLAAERARLRQLALDACRAAAIVPLVWYPAAYYINPNDLGKINKQQVDACVAAIDAAMKEGAK